MKTTIAAITALSALFVLPLSAAGPNDKRLSMEQRLREADIAVALKHYERVCTELMECRLKQDLIAAEDAGKPGDRENQQKLLAHKVDILERYAKQLREELLKAGRVTLPASD